MGDQPGGQPHGEGARVNANDGARGPRNDNRTLKELTAPKWDQQPLAIQYPEIAEGANCELKSSLLHYLPSFHGMSSEDPCMFLAQFHAVCSSMRLPNVMDDQIKLRAFSFTLKDAAHNWFFRLAPNSIDSWPKMQKAFLEKFLPPTKLNQLKKNISNIEQKVGESLYDYLERFKQLVASCPYHGYTEHDLLMYLNGGLTEEDRRLVNAASQGSILNKMPSEAMQLMEELAEGS